MTKQHPLTDEERLDWLRLMRTPNIGPVTFAQLLRRYESAGDALEALPELSRRAGRKRPLIAPDKDTIAEEIERTKAYGGRLIAACEPDYPPLLKALDPPPPVISTLGKIELAASQTIAIVGARNASAAGRKLARDIAADLSAAGYVTVSGLARGIDGEVHDASLAGGTIAVLGGGIDHVYPPQHDCLYAAIAEKGLLVSESPFNHRATAKDFPRRNRIITALAMGTVVIEAAERSGSLISARTASEQGREVMAVPGSPLDPRATGTNRLIRNGATLVRSAEDIIEAVSSLLTGRFEAPPVSVYDNEPSYDTPPPDQLQAVLEALSHHPMPIEEIAHASGIGEVRCAAILVELELSGRAETLSGGLAILAPEM